MKIEMPKRVVVIAILDAVRYVLKTIDEKQPTLLRLGE